MSSKKRRIDAAIIEEVERHKNQQEIKRRKISLSVDSPTKLKVKAHAREALKKLLAEGATMDTKVKLVNTRPISRLSSLNNVSRKLMVCESVQLMTQGKYIPLLPFLTFVGIFDLLASTICVTRPRSKQSYSTENIDEAFTIRLLASVKRYQQNNVKEYWSNASTCPYKMPMGRDAFEHLNAHIAGSTTSNVAHNNVDEVERKVYCFLLLQCLTWL